MDSARLIENLLYTYAERIDAGDLAGVADLFARGRIVGDDSGRPEATFEGRDAVERLYRSTTRIHDDTGTPRTRHVVSNPILEVDDDAGTASCRSCFTVFQATPTLPLQPVITGRYVDTFRRHDDDWWFDTRRMSIDLMGELGEHLLW